MRPSRTVVIGTAALAAAAILGGCHEQKLADSTPAPAAPTKTSPYGEGYEPDILTNPTLQWPAGSTADIVLNHALPIEAIDAAPGRQVEKGRSILTYQVPPSETQQKVNADDVRLDRFNVQADKSAADQAVSLAEQNVQAAEKNLADAKAGKGIYSVQLSRKALEAAQATLARARRQSQKPISSADAKLHRDKPLIDTPEQVSADSELPAPITGTVAWLRAKTGKSAGQPGQVIGQIVDTDAARIRATFDNRYQAVVHAGTQVNVLFAGKTDWSIPGQVVQTERTSTVNGYSENVAVIKLIDQGHMVRPNSRILGIGVRE